MWWLIRAISPTAASLVLLASSWRPVLPSQLISPAWLGPVMRVTCPWAHLAQMAQVQVEGIGPKSACTVLCERQPACHGPLGSSAKEVPGLSSAGST